MKAPTTSFELSEILHMLRAKGYMTLGEAFESVLADRLNTEQDFGPLPADLAEVEEFWSDGSDEQ